MFCVSKVACKYDGITACKVHSFLCKLSPGVVVWQVLIAESYGGQDEPVDALLNNLVDIGVPVILDPLRVKANPTEGTYQVSTLQPAGRPRKKLCTR